MRQNYTLSRGKVYFAERTTGVPVPAMLRYLGNTPELALTVESESLDHVNSDSGVREVDASVDLGTTRTGSFITDSIQMANLALFLYGEKSWVAQVALGGDATETFLTVGKDNILQLGVDVATPGGVKHLNPATVVVEDEGGLGTTYVVGVDYEILAEEGAIYILETGAIADESDIDVTYNITAGSYEKVESGTTAKQGWFKYIADNPRGDNISYDMPDTKLSPNGDMALKGESWQQIPFSLNISKPADGRAAIIASNGTTFA